MMEYRSVGESTRTAKFPPHPCALRLKSAGFPFTFFGKRFADEENSRA